MSNETSDSLSSPATPQVNPDPKPGQRIAIITGASSGMGREFAIQISFIDDVDCLWLIARNTEALEAVAQNIPKPARCLSIDLTDPASLQTLNDLLDAEQPNVRYLVNSAGFGKFGNWEQVGIKNSNAMIDLNCKALVDITQMTIPHMGRGSHLIELASCSAFTPLPDMNVYAASKAFVLSYTRALRWELFGKGITATAVCPAWVKTGFEKEARDSKGGNAVHHMLFAQKAPTVVSRALALNNVHFAVACCGIPAFLLRIVGKFVPHCLTMLGWEGVRRL